MPRNGLTIVALALGLTACGQKQTPQPASSAAPPPASSRPGAQPDSTAAPYVVGHTFFKVEDGYAPAWFLCDSFDRAIVMVFSLPDDDGDVLSLGLDKKSGSHGRTHYRLGAPDPGAGQVYWPLTNPSETGYVRAFNPGMLDDPASATIPPITEVKLGEDVASCRWAPNVVLEGATARRTYLVTREAGQLVYRTFNYDDPAASRPLPDGGPTRTTAPSLEIRGGTETSTPTGRLYAFENDGYRYTVEVGDADHPQAAVMVVKAGKQVQADSFDAYATGY